MRIRRGMTEIKEGGVNVTPLIDIVMCLIIFFMLVAKIGVDTGADRRITIPASLQGLETHLSHIHKIIKDFKPSAVVIDLKKAD